MNIIILFTKDRPITLEKTVRSLQSSHYEKFIVDNSVATQNQEAVKSIARQSANCTYLGKAEFNHFIKANKIFLPDYDFLLREPGQKGWDLGYTRNFALCYAKSIKAKKILFMDDDIEVPDPGLVTHLFNKADDFTFTGAHIRGLVDDSVLGHIATGLGIINERMLSGGFMVFSPEHIDHYFLNIYNEDWIWLFLQLKGKQYCQEGEVFQELTEPFENYKNKIIFQEFGEIVLDGILDLFNTAPWENMRSVPFWKRIIKERREYTRGLYEKAKGLENGLYREIIHHVRASLTPYTPDQFSSLFEKYFSDKASFESLFQSLS